jgi:hypothetical protein
LIDECWMFFGGGERVLCGWGGRLEDGGKGLHSRAAGTAPPKAAAMAPPAEQAVSGAEPVPHMSSARRATAAKRKVHTPPSGAACLRPVPLTCGPAAPPPPPHTEQRWRGRPQHRGLGRASRQLHPPHAPAPPHAGHRRHLPAGQR